MKIEFCKKFSKQLENKREVKTMSVSAMKDGRIRVDSKHLLSVLILFGACGTTVAASDVRPPKMPKHNVAVKAGEIFCPDSWKDALDVLSRANAPKNSLERNKKEAAVKKIKTIIKKYGINPSLACQEVARLPVETLKDKKDKKDKDDKKIAEVARKSDLLTEKTDLQPQILSIDLFPSALAGSNTQKVLVLYDYLPSAAYGRLGLIYAIMLRNLLGHFSVNVTMANVSSYQSGNLNGYDTVFYIGSYYDNALPAAFLSDVMQTTATVVWFKNNIWKLAWDPAYDFTNDLGIAFDGLVGMNANPTPSNPNPGFFDTVVYKGLSFSKFYEYDAGTNSVFADPVIGATRVVDAQKAESVVPINNAATSQVYPYVIRSGNFWYVADIPFSFIGPRDRYLVMSDLLYDMLGVESVDTHLAMVRLEDVGYLNDPAHLRTLSNYFYEQQIPFSIALIPSYRDPFGIYNNGVAQQVDLMDPEMDDVRAELDYALTRNGSIVMHGFTHQYEQYANPYDAISGNDYEFWNIVANAPFAGLATEAQVLARLDAGLAQLSDAGYTPFAWEVPHYHASAVASRAFPKRFERTYQRAVYYTSDVPDFSVDYYAGQFFPYAIESDYYGQTIIPENLGNIEYDISHIDPTSNFNYTWQDLLTNAEYALSVRSGFASFFFHPFWLEPELGQPGLNDLKSLVQGISNLGYTWVGADTIQ